MVLFLVGGRIKDENWFYQTNNKVENLKWPTFQVLALRHNELAILAIF